MVQHLLHIQNLVTPEIWYNSRRFRRSVSPLGASGSGFGIFTAAIMSLTMGIRAYAKTLNPLPPASEASVPLTHGLLGYPRNRAAHYKFTIESRRRSVILC